MSHNKEQRSPVKRGRKKIGDTHRRATAWAASTEYDHESEVWLLHTVLSARACAASADHDGIESTHSVGYFGFFPISLCVYTPVYIMFGSMVICAADKIKMCCSFLPHISGPHRHRCLLLLFLSAVVFAAFGFHMCMLVHYILVEISIL